MSKNYKLTPAFFTKLQKRYYFIVVPIVLFAIFVPFFINIMQSGIHTTGIVIMSIELLIIVLYLRRSLAQERQKWASYVLSIDSDLISRTRDTLEPIQISKNDISSIREYPNESIVIQSGPSKKKILIPATLEDYSEIRLLLSQWHEIEISKDRRNLRIIVILLLIILSAIAFRIIFFGENKILAITIETVLLIILISSAIIFWKSTYYNKQTKRALLLFTPILILMIAMRLYFLLFAK